MSTTHLWRLIQEWRDGQEFPVSQAALAGKIGVSRSAMSQWKAGQARPGPENLHELSRVTRISYERLLGAVMRDMGYLGEPIEVLDGTVLDPDDHVLAARDADDDAEAEAQQGEA